MKMKRIVLFVTLAASSYFGLKFFAARFGNHLSEIPVYRKATYAIAERFEPINALSTADSVVSNLVYDGLFTVDENLKVIPSLVKTFSVSPDGITYDFELDDSRFFQDGQRLTVEDTLSSLERLRANDSPVKETFKRMQQIRKTGAANFQITLDTPYPPFVALLAAPTAKVSKRIDGEAYNIGTGPFRFSGISKIDGHNVLALERVAKHLTGNKSPKIQKIELWELSEAEAIELAKKSVIHDTAIYTSRRIELVPQNRLTETMAPSAVTWLVALNTRNPLLKSNLARSCLNAAFKREAFVSKFIPDQMPAIGMLPPTLAGSGTLPKIETPMEDQCLVELSGKSFVLDIPSELDNAKQMCSFIGENYKSLNVVIHCNPLPFGSLLERVIAKTSDLSLLAMTLDLPDVEYFLNTFETGAKFNLSSYSSATIDENLRLARLEQDRIKRASFFQKINEEIYTNVVTINISYPYHISYRHSCLNNFRIGLAGDAYINYDTISLDPLCPKKEDFL